MRRIAWPLASTLLALSACNALTGVSELSTCPSCDDVTELDASLAADVQLPDTSVRDGAGAGDAKDASMTPDTSTMVDADADAAIGCQGDAACVRVMFATSVSFTGNLGGIAGADAKCQALADLAIVARVKGRTFVAWVSTGVTPVATRLTHGTQPYIRPDGVQIASSYLDLTDNNLQNGISVDENGGNRNGAGAWTATSSNGGGFSGQNCTDWSTAANGLKGDSGNVGGTGSGWSAGGADDCSSTHSLYCVEK